MSHASIRLIYSSVVASLIRRAWVVNGLEHCRALAVVLGVGPQTLPDGIYHAALLLVLVCGFIMLARNSLAAG
jgi:hypothetical protein